MTTVLLGLDREAPLAPADHARLAELTAGYRLVITKERAEMEAVLDDVEIAAGGVPIPLILRAPQLRWYQQWGAGADWLLRHPEAAARPFVLTNTSGIHATQISEHILTFMLALTHRLPAAFQAQAQGRWQRPGDHELGELAGATLLLIGLGAIGSRTAELAAAFGMRVLGVRRSPREPLAAVERIFPPERLADVLPEADFVVLTVPLTRDSRHMIGEAELRLMKSTAYLINIGRGATVDECSLVTALSEGWIAGAGLDVFETEPLPVDSPLWRAPNVIITAHYSGSSPHYNTRALAVFLDNFGRYRAGQPLRNIVDKHLGY